MRARKALALFSTFACLAAAAVVGSTVGAGSAAAQPGCPSLYVVAIPGTWEHGNDVGLLGAVTNGLPRNIRTDYVGYPATAFPWEADVYGVSKQQAVNNARGMVTSMVGACPGTRIALLGYSQGADAAGDLAAEIGTGIGAIPANKVAAVGLLSDPRRSPTDALVGPPVGGAGAGGPRVGGFGWVSQQTRTFCAAGDLYCSTASDDFFVRGAGFFAQLSDPSPANIWRYSQEGGAIVNDLLAAGGVGVLQQQFNDQANERREQELRTFYQSGIHQDYRNYVVDRNGATATQWLRNWLLDVA
ncbi:cutinase family protein [Aldersonia sp. NBC_00410]|uniref:cutinase family protein n=1 Tax=Aldersonia sp. NBC_00410 TaxID=2975954 RepID=UPI0022522678|nr:cutinase family protein [Aldersonia sp. NBC_00410]MCX5045085.1 cutinase family protein [Aldersonia sp. NBC_00410]